MWTGVRDKQFSLSFTKTVPGARFKRGGLETFGLAIAIVELSETI